MILLDTSVFISLFKEKELFDSIFAALPNEEIVISSITIAEIELGFLLFKSGRKRNQIGEFWQYIKNYEIQILPVNTETAKTYAQIQSELMAKGKQLSHFDALIAATAIASDLLLVSKDIDFKRVKGLKLKLI